jgi:cell division transport system ATP-binding protein
MIEFSHVYKTYTGPVHALKNISLSIEKGEFVFLVGPSGAGKSTLFKMISAYDKITSGTLKVGDVELAKLNLNEIPYYRRRIGVIFQDFKLLKDRTVFENIALPLRIRGDKNSTIENRVSDVLSTLGLSEKADFLPEFISGGEQQRTAIGRAIIHQPAVLIADEPTGNLDSQLSKDIMHLLERICAQGTTVFVASHDLQLIDQFKKRKIQIEAGVLK